MRFHPKAFLSAKRNVRLGLTARTKVIQVLEKDEADVRSISQTAGMRYRTALYHLRLLEAEKVVTRKGNKPFLWGLTGAGQQRLVTTGSN